MLGSIRVAVVDDHLSQCALIRATLGAWPTGEVIVTSLGGKELEFTSTWAGKIDLVVIGIPTLDRIGLGALEWIRRNQPSTRTLAVNSNPTPEFVREVMALGACGIVSNAVGIEELRIAIEHIHLTGFHFNAFVRATLTHKPDPDYQTIVKRLTRRERDLMREISAPDDPPYSVVAQRMGVSLNTVHAHRARLFEKFGVDNRLGLMRAARNWKLDRDRSRG